MLTWTIALPALVAGALLTGWQLRRRGRLALRILIAVNGLVLAASAVLIAMAATAGPSTAAALPMLRPGSQRRRRPRPRQTGRL